MTVKELIDILRGMENLSDEVVVRGDEIEIQHAVAHPTVPFWEVVYVIRKSTKENANDNQPK